MGKFYIKAALFKHRSDASKTFVNSAIEFTNNGDTLSGMAYFPRSKQCGSVSRYTGNNFLFSNHGTYFFYIAEAVLEGENTCSLPNYSPGAFYGLSRKSCFDKNNEKVAWSCLFSRRNSSNRANRPFSLNSFYMQTPVINSINVVFPYVNESNIISCFGKFPAIEASHCSRTKNCNFHSFHLSLLLQILQIFPAQSSEGVFFFWKSTLTHFFLVCA